MLAVLLRCQCVYLREREKEREREKRERDKCSSCIFGSLSFVFWRGVKN